MNKWLSTGGFWLLSVGLFAQTPTLSAESDSTHSVPKHSVKQATLMALVPGAGQIYNKKYWKLPLVWGALGGATYYYAEQHKSFISYKNLLQYLIDHPTLSSYSDVEQNAPELLESLPLPLYGSTTSSMGQEAIGYMESFRKSREYAFFGILGVYALSILDANVDAHLFYFDVSDDLTLSPAAVTTSGLTQAVPGFKFTYSFP